MRLLHNKTNAWLNVMELVHTLKMVKLLFSPIDVGDGIQGLVSAREVLCH